MFMSQWRKICAYCMAEGVPRRSFAVALIVGTILNLINQGDSLLSGAHLYLAKIVLTFAVPYCVATYAAGFIARTSGGRACRDLSPFHWKPSRISRLLSKPPRT